MFNVAQIVAHLVGDYIFQSHWMATEKTKRTSVAMIHALVYSVPFLLFYPSLIAWLVIVFSHFLIDRWRLVRYVVFAKNFISPKSFWPKWENSKGTGYDKNVPDWLASWLMIIADNTIHIIINAVALTYL